MPAPSAQFLQDLIYGPLSVSYLYLWYDGMLVSDEPLPAAEWSVSADATRLVRRTGNYKLADSVRKWIPRTAQDRLSPYGAELQPVRGLIRSDGVEETASLGFLRLNLTEMDLEGEGVLISGSCSDRMSTISRNRFTRPYAVDGGTSGVDAITGIAQGGLPGINVVALVSRDFDCPLLVFDALSDRAEAIKKIADSRGWEAFVNGDGELVIRDQPDPASVAVSDYYVAGEESKLAKVKRVLSNEPGYNGVIATGGPAGGTPFRAEAWDDNPDSPTYYLGAYGQVPMGYNSEYFTSQEQVDAAAIGLLHANRGITEQVQGEGIPNPFTEGGDVCEVEVDELGVESRYLVETFTISGDETSLMPFTMRKRYAA